MDWFTIKTDTAHWSWEDASIHTTVVGLSLGLASLIFIAGLRICLLRYPCSIPRVGTTPGWFSSKSAKADFVVNGAKIIEDGYRMYKNSMFLVQTADEERVVLSARYANELRAVPETTLSLRQTMSHRHLGPFTNLDIVLTSHLHSDVCRTELTHNLGGHIQALHEEVCFWLAKLVPDGIQKPAEIKAHQTMLSVTAGATSRVLVNLPSCRDEQWLKTMSGYPLDVFYIATALRPYPPFLRPLVASWTGCGERLDRHLRTAGRLFGPLFERYLANHENKKQSQRILQCLAELARGDDRKPEILERKLLFLIIASVHSSTATVTHALFDICAHPEYVASLREEVNSAVRAHGWTLSSVNNMRRLDSFLRESQRINHPGLLSFNRKALKRLCLSDGAVIPAGAFICMATRSIALDPENYPDPNRFKGMRFYERWESSSEQDAHRHQFVSTGPDNLAFGHGNFACPGRFFAAAQAKILLATVLLNYDVAFPGSQTARPENIFSGETIGPDRTQSIMFTPRITSDTTRTQYSL